TDGVPVIALATQRAVYEKTLSNAKETKSRGGKVLLFTTKDAVVPEGIADYVVRLDEHEDLSMPPQPLVPPQQSANYFAALRECVADYVVRLDECEDVFRPLQLIVPVQLFAYYLAGLRGFDEETPRTLAKSVPVE